MNKVSIVLEEHLKARGMSILQLAEDTGRTYGSVHSIVRNRVSRLDLDVLADICVALGLQPGDVLHLN